MELSPPRPDRPVPTDIATALRDAATSLGHRPAVTVISPRGREEQSVASLLQWAAKGAHMLELELLCEPGDELALDAPLSWTSAAVCLAAWWAGVVVVLDAGATDDTAHGTASTAPAPPVAVIHESRHPAAASDVLWLGDAIDGSPVGDVVGEPWVRAVQTFPDQPPAPRAHADGAALRSGSSTWSQRQLLDRAGSLVCDSGTLGLDAAEIEPVTGLIAAVLRPLIVGRPTAVLHGVDRSAAHGEKVTAWLPAPPGRDV